MSAREDILGKVRANRPSVDRPLPDVPLFGANIETPLLDTFKRNLQRMGGLYLEPPPSGDVLTAARDRIATAHVVCSTVWEIQGNCDIAAVRTAQELAAVDIAIVRAAFAVAETGSVLLSDADLKINAVAYLAQHLIVLLDPASIVGNLHHAYRRSEFRDCHYACFHSGPSATADIEGVLIHGAQGVRSLSVLPLAASTQPGR